MLRGWKKTTPYTARITGGGSQKRRINRSNVVIVASVENQGPYDYKCDGIDDDVQIQAAIDYLSQTFSGGMVQLTDGSFILKKAIGIKKNIVLSGCGSSTKLKSGVSSPSGFVYSGYDCELHNFEIDGESKLGTNNYGIAFSENNITTIISNVRILNIKSSSGIAAGIAGYSAGDWGNTVINCYVYNIETTDVNNSAYGIRESGRVQNNIIDTVIGGIYGYGLKTCKKCQQNKASNCSTASYSFAYADSGTAYPCADTADGGYNS